MTDKQIFGTMNGLRGIAAIAVVCYHFSLRGPLHLQNGFLAVDFFFVLSGFVIAHSYEKRLKEGLSLKDFVLVRFIRLYPLYLLGTLFPIIAVVASLISKGQIIESNLDAFRAIPSALLMLPTPPMKENWLDTTFYTINGPAWTLLYEFIINIVFASFVTFFTKKRLIAIMAISALALCGLTIINGEIFENPGWGWGSLHIGIFRISYSFFAGVLLCKLYQEGTAIPRVSPIILAVILPLLLVLPSVWMVPFCVLIAFPVLVAVASRSEPKGILLSIFTMLGVASYAVYAIHLTLHDFISAIMYKLGYLHGMWSDIALTILIVPICILVDRLYDTPVRKYLTSKFMSRPQRLHIQLQPAPTPQ